MKTKSCMPAAPFFNVNIYGEIESKLLIYMHTQTYTCSLDTDADPYMDTCITLQGIRFCMRIHYIGYESLK